MLHRAYSLIDVKEFDGPRRKFSGTATSPVPDRIGDVINPKGVKFAPALPLLLYHDSQKPVGEARFGKATANGIPFESVISEVDRPGVVKERLNEAIDSLNAKPPLIRGVSIGFRPLVPPTFIKETGGLYYDEVEVLELSMVVIPMHQDATIHTLKSFDTNAPVATPSTAHADVKRSSAHVDAPNQSARRGASTMNTSYTDRIKEKDTQIGAKQAALNALQDKVSNDGRSKDEHEREEFDTLKGEIKALLDEQKDLRDLEEMAKSAVPVPPSPSAPPARPREPHAPVVHEPKLEPGVGLARFAMASIQARKGNFNVMDVAKSRWPSDTRLQAYIQKANVPAATTTDATWLGPLVDQTNLANEFIEYLRPRTIVGRIPGLRRVPFNVRVTGQSTGAVANWVGQGKGKPVTSFSTFATTLLRTKIAAIAVITEELALDSSPSAEQLVRDELARAVIERMDIDFIDPAQAAVANVNPASITNGVTPLSPTGVTEAFARADMVTLLANFVENNVDPTSLVLIMPNSLALGLSLMVNSLGQASFPGITPTGGTLLGIPVVASQYAANASGSGNLVIALNAGDIFLADDGQVRIDASRDASIEMNDAPTVNSTTSTGASLVSMYQTNSIAIRAERFVNWAKVRSTAVVFMDDVNWGSVGSA